MPNFWAFIQFTKFTMEFLKNIFTKKAIIEMLLPSPNAIRTAIADADGFGTSNGKQWPLINPSASAGPDGIANEESQQQPEGYINLGQNIFPVIKTNDDSNIQTTLKSDNPILYDELAEGIIVTYGIDLEDRIEMVAQSHLKNSGLSHRDIKLVAERNIRLKINQNCQVSRLDLSGQIPEAKPFFQVEMDSSYNPSVMIVNEFWSQAEKIAGSSLLAVSIPAKNLLFFSNKNEIQSFVAMKAFAQQLYKASKTDHIELTSDTYIRKNGKWTLFLENAD